MGYVTVKVNLDVLFLNANVTIIKSAKGVALPLLNGYNVYYHSIKWEMRQISLPSECQGMVTGRFATCTLCPMSFRPPI